MTQDKLTDTDIEMFRHSLPVVKFALENADHPKIIGTLLLTVVTTMMDSVDVGKESMIKAYPEYSNVLTILKPEMDTATKVRTILETLIRSDL